MRLGWGQAQVGVVGQFGSALAGSFGQVAFGHGLQPPGDAFDQPGFVTGVGRFAEDLGKAAPQLGHGQRGQGGDVLGQVSCVPPLVGKNGKPLRTVSTVWAASSRQFSRRLGDFWPKRGELAGVVYLSKNRGIMAELPGCAWRG